MSPRVAGWALAGLLVASCASLTPMTASQTLEVSETGAEALYVAVATALKVDSTATPSRAASDLVIWRQAWADLGTVRAAYAEGQSILGGVSALTADQTAASKAVGHPIATPPPS